MRGIPLLGALSGDESHRSMTAAGSPSGATPERRPGDRAPADTSSPAGGPRVDELADGARTDATDARPSVAVLTNCFAPYRTPFLNALARRCRLVVSFDTRREDDREWTVDEADFDFEWVLTRSLTLQPGSTRPSRRAVHVPLNLMAVLARHRPDVVISSELGFRTANAAAYCEATRRPLIVWWEGTPHTEAARGGLGTLRRTLMVRRATRAWSNGKESAAYLTSLGVVSARIDLDMTAVDTVGLSADVERSRPAAPRLRDELGLKGHVLLNVGALTERKGISELLRAMTILASDPSLPAWSALFVGSGPCAAEIHAWGRSHPGVPVATTGYVQAPELARYYAAADTFVMPSAADVWGMVCLEALAAGIPQVTSKFAGSATDLVSSPEIGNVIDPTDAESVAAVLAARLRSGPSRVPPGLRQRCVEYWSASALADRAMQSVGKATPKPSGVNRAATVDG